VDEGDGCDAVSTTQPVAKATINARTDKIFGFRII
jgi:hypothetical protein